MAFSTQRVTSDGTLDTLAISIEYFDRSEISVLFDGVLTVTGWSWVGTTDHTISFSPAVPNGVEVMLIRATDLENIRHQFSMGAAFKASTVDEDFTQILHIAQEARETATLTDIYQNLDMHGYKLTHVGAGTDPLDAVNLGQFSVHDATIVGYKDAAAASAAAAAASAEEAQDIVDNIDPAGFATSAQGAKADTAVQPSDFNTATGKATPVDADGFGLWDSVAEVFKKCTWANIKATFISTVNTWSAVQKSTVTTDNDLTIDLAATMDAVCTPTAGGTLTFSNIAAGQKIEILFINGANYAITKGANIKCPSTLFTNISATGRYVLAGRCLDGTNIDLTVSGALA